MEIKITTDNCAVDKHFLINELASAKVIVELEFEKIVSMQSQKKRQKELINIIHQELGKFQWVISDSVNIELVWYLNAIERQETDKVGDLDNITKPILDALTGENGILMDDSQIGSIHTFWMSRNELKHDNYLRIEISFSNDYCFDKSDLIFIQYEGAVCLPLNVDFNSEISMLGALAVVWARKMHRNTAKKIRKLGADADRFLVQSSYDIHRTRLSGFSKKRIYSLDDFKKECRKNGLTYKSYLSFFKRLLKRA